MKAFKKLNKSFCYSVLNAKNDIFKNIESKIETYNFDKKISENDSIDIIENLHDKEKILIAAEPSSGKTTAIINSFKKLSEKNSNKIYVIACPNRSQNIQNENLYGIYSVVGGKEILNMPVISMVYDKAKAIKEYAEREKKEIILAIDEAHQLIDSTLYRKKALQELEELQSISTNIIHITATPRKLLEVYEYDNINIFETNFHEKNIKQHFLIKLTNEAIIAQVFNFIKNISEMNIGKPLIFINNIKTIQALKMLLEKQGFNVGVIDSKNKNNDIFKCLENKSLLPTEKYDIFFATSVIECGININNTDIMIINLILESNKLDFDSIKQTIKRIRKKIKVALTFIVDKTEDEKNKHSLKCQQAIFKEIEYVVKKQQTDHQKTFNLLIDYYGYEKAFEYINAILNLDITKNESYKALEVKNKEIVINKEKLVKAQFKAFDSQFYYHHKELEDKLTEIIDPEEKITIFKFHDLIKKSLKESIKNINDEIKAIDKENKLKAKNILKNLTIEEQEILEKYIKDNEIYKTLHKALKEKINFLSEEGKILNLLEKALNENILIKSAIELIIHSEKDSEILKYIKLHNYIMRNNANVPITTNNEFGAIRSVFDSVMKKRGRITKIKLNELLELLIEKRIWKLNDKELTKSNTNKLLEAIKTIYNISQDKKGYLINSLKKKI